MFTKSVAAGVAASALLASVAFAQTPTTTTDRANTMTPTTTAPAPSFASPKPALPALSSYVAQFFTGGTPVASFPEPS